MKNKLVISGVVLLALIIVITTRYHRDSRASQEKKQNEPKLTASVCRKMPFNSKISSPNSSQIDSLEKWSNQFDVKIDNSAIKALIEKIKSSSEKSKVTTIPASEYLDGLIISSNARPIMGVIRIDYEPYLRVCKVVNLHKNSFEINVEDEANFIFVKDQELWNLISGYASRGSK